MEGKVTVLTPNGRRQNIKITPNTTILQILEETCQKHNLDSHEYCLKHHNKEVGLTQMFRFSGLPNNCLLEMSQTERRRKESNVDICVQFEDGSRLQGQFKPSNSIWQVVEKLDAEELENYSNPIAIYMRQEIIGKERLEDTTLKSLGIIEGRAMIRIINKSAEDLKSQANVYVPPTVKENPKEGEGKSRTTQRNGANTGGGGFAITKDVVQSLRKSGTTISANAENLVDNAETAMNQLEEPENAKYDWGSGTGYSIRSSQHNQDITKSVDNTEETNHDMDTEPEVLIIGDRNAILYSLDDAQTIDQTLPDSFFDLTVDDLKLVLRDLKRASRGNEETPLLTERLRHLEEQKTMLNKIAQYKNCVIRIQFPDRHVLQGIFKPIDKISDVMEFVRKFLHNERAEFHLFTIPRKYVLPLDKTLLELDFVPTAVVHFALDGVDEEAAVEKNSVEPTYLKLDLMDKLTTTEGACYVAKKMRITNPRATNRVIDGSDVSLHTLKEHRSPDSSTGAIPKRQPSHNPNQKI